MVTLGDKIQPEFSKKSAFSFYCKDCDYGTSKKCNYNTHILSTKHKMITEGYIKGQNSATIQPKISNQFHSTDKDFLICSCGKQYQHRQGLWRHKKKCNYKEDITNSDEPSDKEIIMMLIKDNSEFKNMMMKVLENGTHNTTTNSNNKAFNLQFFLNETCKDAMNIMDFVESIKLQLSDLERVGELGYVEGISNIIIKNLKELDVSQRPVHCTDKKRETMYIKDENKWEKDEEQKKMHNVVRKVAAKNARLVLKYKELHPDCNTYHSKYSDQYNKIIIEAFGGSGENDFEKEEKIIRNISKVIGIEKE